LRWIFSAQRALSLLIADALASVALAVIPDAVGRARFLI
jgi:hypothetical protein